MKILFLVPRYPYPPYRGDILRYYNFARVLSKKHELTAVSFVQSEEEQIALPEGVFTRVHTVPLRPLQTKVNMARSILSLTPLQVAYFSSKKMQKVLNELITSETYDVLYVFHLRMAQFVKAWHRPYKILDFTDSVSLFMKRMLRYERWFMRPILFREWLTTARYEAQIIKGFDECWVISPVDKGAVRAQPDGVKMDIVPNGIDTDYFRPSWPRDAGLNLLFVGYMGIESVDTVIYLCRQIYPLIKAQVPEVTFTIVGANPPVKVRQLSRDLSIKVLGYVEDLRPAYNSASVLVAPTRFTVGIQNKVLEAMAMEVPVVCSTFANEGIFAEDGQEAFIEDDPRAFAERVAQLLRSPELRRKIGSNAREFVKERFIWSTVVERMDKIASQI